MMTRRDFVQKTVLAAAATPLLSSLATPEAWAASSKKKDPASTSSSSAPSATAGPFKLPPLGYAVDALEPYLDAKTMQLHHDKHHAAYVSKLNAALVAYPDLGKRPIEELLYNLEAVPEPVRDAVRNQGGGHYNHTLLWLSLSKSGGKPSKELQSAMDKHFQSMKAFEEAFTKAALDVFGSGWAWLAMAKDGTLSIEKTQNQDTPLSWGKRPLLGIDVWEHAYYLKYQNRRPDYVTAFLKVVNWDFVSGVHGALLKA